MKGSITPERVANQVMMLRTRHRGSFLIVEGSTDAKLFSELLDSEACRLVIAHSKYNATKGISLLDERGIKGALAVVDADYWVLEGIIPNSPNLFLTDVHDLEAMLLQSSALERVIVEYLPGDEMEHAEDIAEAVREKLLKVGVPIGYLRWISFRENLGLNVSSLQAEEFVHLPELRVDVDRLIQIVRVATKGIMLSASDLREKVIALQRREADPWHIVQGHDLIELMETVLPLVVEELVDPKIGKRVRRKARNEKMDEDLRLAYQPSFFVMTRLYVSIREWESNSHPYKVLA